MTMLPTTILFCKLPVVSSVFVPYMVAVAAVSLAGRSIASRSIIAIYRSPVYTYRVAGPVDLPVRVVASVMPAMTLRTGICTEEGQQYCYHDGGDDRCFHFFYPLKQ